MFARIKKKIYIKKRNVILCDKLNYLTGMHRSLCFKSLRCYINKEYKKSKIGKIFPLDLTKIIYKYYKSENEIFPKKKEKK